MNYNKFQFHQAPRLPTFDRLPTSSYSFKDTTLGKRICQSEFFPSRACGATCYAFKSPPSWQELMLVARELLLLHPDQVITAPVVRPPARVWVVTLLPQYQREDADYDQDKRNRNLTMRIKSKGLLPIKEGFNLSPPPNDVWQECLQFSIQARLSPKWSRVGEYLFHGRDFLSSTIIEAVKPQLRTTYDDIVMFSQKRKGNQVSNYQEAKSCTSLESTTEERIYLYLEGCQFRWKRINLCDLQIRQDKLEKYMRGEINAITYHHLGIGRLCVLPNLTMGRLLSITRNIQQCKDIQDWAHMKRYWKNLYGYRLHAEEKEGAKFYCNIIFDQSNDFGRPSDKTIFCYPESCVRLHEPLKVFRHQADRDVIVDTFLADLRSKVPDVCGLPLRFPIGIANSTESNEAITQKATKRSLDVISTSTVDLSTKETVEKKRLKLPPLFNCNEE